MVLRGNDIKDQSFEVALFQEMATAPTSLEASRFCDLLGLLEGNMTEGRDVEQAYLLADMRGPATYIVLPRELWSTAMYQMRRPVVLLEKHCMATRSPEHSGTNIAHVFARPLYSVCFQTIGPAVIGTTRRIPCL